MKLRNVVVTLSLAILGVAYAGQGWLPSVEASSDRWGSIEALESPGRYAAGFTSFLLTDSSRPGAAGYDGRPIQVFVWYPTDKRSIGEDTAEAIYPIDMVNLPGLTSPSTEWEAMGRDPAYQESPVSRRGPFPLVMFSPGWGPPAWMEVSIGTRLASHGFVVAALTHTGDPWFSPAVVPADHFALALWNRPRDLSFSLTTLLQRNVTDGDLLFGAIDPHRVAAAGHSAGGAAAIIMAGGDDTAWDYGDTDPFAWMDGPIPEDVPKGPTQPDRRIKVLALVDAANQELRIKDLKRVHIPVLSVNEEWDAIAANFQDVPDSWQTWQARQHAAFSGHPSYRTDVAETNHWSFGDWCDGLTVMDRLGLATIYGSNDDVRSWSCQGVMPSRDVMAITTRYMLAFLKTELLGERAYQRMLTPGWALSRETGIEFFVTERRRPVPSDGEWPDESIYFAHQPEIQHWWTGRPPRPHVPSFAHRHR